MQTALFTTPPEVTAVVVGAGRDASRLRPRPSLVRILPADHDEYLSSFHHLRLEGFVLARGACPWSLTRGTLPSCTLEHGVDGAPWAAWGSSTGGAVTYVFAGSPGAQLRVEGQEASQGTLCVLPPGSRVSIVARRPADWFVVTVAEEELIAFARTRNIGSPGAGAEAGLLRSVRPEELTRVRALAHLVLEVLGSADPAGLSPGAAAALEQSLLGELVGLASGSPPPPSRRNGSPRIARRSVLERVEELLDARQSGPVYVADLCAATGLPERTLRHILVEQYGVSPMRLLRNRRLCQLRRRLKAEDAGGERLARIAERYGFRHMGTLAADYRDLFGELPSETRRFAALVAPTHVPGVRTAPFRRGGSDCPPEVEVPEVGGWSVP